MATTDADRIANRERVLGWGLAFPLTMPGFDLDRDIEFTPSANGRDLAVVRGPDNLGQALAVALTTLRGSSVFNTEFGFDGLNALAEPTEPVLARQRVRIGVITVLDRDPRVRRIIDVALADHKPSRTLTVHVQFETVAGDVLSVQLGELPDA